MSVAVPTGGWHYRRSLASRVVLLTTMAVALSVAIVSVGAFVTVRMQLKSSLDDSLQHRAERGASQLRAIARIDPNSQIPPVYLASADLRIGYAFPDGTAEFPDNGVHIPLDGHEAAIARAQSGSSLRTIRVDGTDYRVVAVPTHVDANNQPVALVLAESLKPQEDLLFKLGLVTLFFGLAGIIIAGLAGWGVARNGLRPVRRLTRSVEGIAETEDLTPIQVEGDDEVARLATAFNQMLTSLAASRDRQRQLVADAGHELRTPLTSLRTNIDLLTQVFATESGLPPGAREELLGDVRAQLEELSTLVIDLVELARDEPLPHVTGQVELTEVLDQAVARVRRRAAGLHFDVAADPWFVDGDAAAIERALTNLLDNAAKWSPSGGTVHVRLAGGEVVVDDEGTGIAEADRAHVFERFYRSTESRSMPGSGLGLSIVAQVAERHGGSVTVDRSPSGGARLVLRLPGSAHPKPVEPPPIPSRVVERAL